jgi:integrase
MAPGQPVPGSTRGATPPAARTTRGLTATQVAALEPPASGRRYVAVGGVTGLQLMLTAAGARTWVLQYRRHGEGRAGAPLRYTIGDARALTLADARREAERLRGAIARGEDQAASRRKALQQEREVPRMRDQVEDWLKDHVATKKKPQTLRQYRRLWETHARPALGMTKVPEVTFSQVDALHRALRSTPTTANRLVAMLGSYFGWCEAHGIIPRLSNPARGVERFPEEERERYLTSDEIQRFGAALCMAEPVGLPPAERLKERGKKTKFRPKSADRPVRADPFAVAALRFALLSGWRIGEVCPLRWDAIDKARAVATLGDTKTGRAGRPIGAAALLLLDELPRVEGSPYVFPSSRRGFSKREDKHRTDRPIGVPRRLWEAVRDHAKLEGVRIHDLRNSFGATAANAGHSLLLSASLLSHTQTRTSERYAKARRDVRQDAGDEVASELADLLGRQG